MDDQTYQIIGAAIEVHKELGCGFLEPVYQEALELELTDRKIPFWAQLEMPVFYKGRQLRASYRADIPCYDSVVVELKALAPLQNFSANEYEKRNCESTCPSQSDSTDLDDGGSLWSDRHKSKTPIFMIVSRTWSTEDMRT